MNFKTINTCRLLSSCCGVVRRLQKHRALFLGIKLGLVQPASQTLELFHGEKEQRWLSTKTGNFPKGKFDEKHDKHTAKDNNDDVDSATSEEEPDPYAPFPDDTNPLTGEIGGPKGPEPTRFGDWERKGRVTDF